MLFRLAATFTAVRQMRRIKRFAALGLQIQPDEVITSGWPWRSTVCLRGTDHLRGPDGTVVYENRYVIWGHLRWGRLRDHEVYEDTEKAAALDAWISLHPPRAGQRRTRADRVGFGR